MEKIIKVGNIVGQGNSQGGSVFLTQGISPTLLSGMSHGNVMPYIVEIKKINKKEMKKMDETLIYRGGCDLTFNKPTLLNYFPTISSRYDAGICKHRLERVGILEIFKINKEQAQNEK